MLALGVLSVEKNIPIGIEFRANEKNEPKLDIDVPKTPLVEVLNLIVQQEPGYVWEVRDDVINFSPVQDRNPFFATLLKTPDTVLKQDHDRYTRRYAVFCIAQIGGKSAHQILRQALESESDPCVASCIRASLTAFDNKSRPHYISDVGRTTWYTTFLCNGE
jgi:hypothetical protein